MFWIMLKHLMKFSRTLINVLKLFGIDGKEIDLIASTVVNGWPFMSMACSVTTSKQKKHGARQGCNMSPERL